MQFQSAGVSFVRIVGCVLMLCRFGLEAAAQETHPFSVHDMLAMDRISDPQVSPDGRHIVFVVRETDLEANRGRTDLWLVATVGPRPGGPLRVQSGLADRPRRRRGPAGDR